MVLLIMYLTILMHLIDIGRYKLTFFTIFHLKHQRRLASEGIPMPSKVFGLYLSVFVFGVDFFSS